MKIPLAVRLEVHTFTNSTVSLPRLRFLFPPFGSRPRRQWKPESENCLDLLERSRNIVRGLIEQPLVERLIDVHLPAFFFAIYSGGFTLRPSVIASLRGFFRQRSVWTPRIAIPASSLQGSVLIAWHFGHGRSKSRFSMAKVYAPVERVASPVGNQPAPLPREVRVKPTQQLFRLRVALLPPAEAMSNCGHPGPTQC
jgi:hypothetical protein